MAIKFFNLSTIVLVIFIQSLFSQPNAIELSTVRNGIGSNLGIGYQVNHKKLSYSFGIKYHLNLRIGDNLRNGDNTSILKNGHAFNFIQHFGTDFDVYYSFWNINDKVRAGMFYNNQISYLGSENYNFVPLFYFYDPVVKKNVLGYSYDLFQYNPMLIIEQNTGIKTELFITDRIKILESFGSGIMLYFNKNNPGLSNIEGISKEFIFPFFKIAVEYTFKPRE